MATAGTPTHAQRAPADPDGEDRAGRQRVAGLDVARALAIVGMVLVNYRIVLAGGDRDAPLRGALELLDGRAAAVFVVLAGMGASILTRRARGGGAAVWPARRRLLGRALVLLALGVPLMYVWEAEILHVYALLMLVAALTVTASTRALVALAVGAVLLFPALNVPLDYHVPDEFATFTSATVAEDASPWATLRDLVFEGHYPLAPWAGLFLAGMALGRLPLTRATARRMALWGLGLTVATELTTGVLMNTLSGETALRAVDRGPVPPTPFFALAGLGAALLVIGGSVLVAGARPHAATVRVLASGGRCALTVYVAHLVVGLGVPALLGRDAGWSVAEATAYALVVGAASIGLAHAWLARRERGPLEALVRRLAG